jgi:hypothetical protein
LSAKAHVITESFEEYVKTTPASIRCRLCKFYRANTTEAEAIRATISKRGATFGQGNNASARSGAVTPRQISLYIQGKYPEYQVSEHNVYDHFRHGHEEAK